MKAIYFSHGAVKNLIVTSILIFLVTSFSTCKKDKLTVPVLSTTAISDISFYSATSGGKVTSEGWDTIISKGVCWSTSPGPTINDNKTIDSGTGSYISKMTGLNINTPYYVRAYATNSKGTAYGNELSFTSKALSISLGEGLLAYYPFTGNADDNSGNKNNGTISGASLTSDKFGHVNNAYYFNGSNNYISLKPATSFVGLNTYSISLWEKPTTMTYNGGGMIYCLGSTTYGPVHGLTYQPGNSLFAGSYNTGGNPIQSYSSSCCFSPNEWIYVVVTRDINTINLYINGTKIPPQGSSATNNQIADYGPGPFAAILGGRSSLDYQYFFTGIIDEVRIYNRVLTASEILELKEIYH